MRLEAHLPFSITRKLLNFHRTTGVTGVRSMSADVPKGSFQNTFFVVEKIVMWVGQKPKLLVIFPSQCFYYIFGHYIGFKIFLSAFCIIHVVVMFSIDSPCSCGHFDICLFSEGLSVQKL